MAERESKGSQAGGVTQGEGEAYSVMSREPFPGLGLRTMGA